MKKAFYQFYYYDDELDKWFKWDCKEMTEQGAKDRVEDLTEFYHVIFKMEEK